MAKVTEITLSDGQKVQVKRLGLFEIEANVGRPNTDPYTIEGDINGKPYRQIYILDYERPEPTKPFDECKEGSKEYWDWLEWNNWQDGLSYLRDQLNGLDGYFSRVEAYILNNCVKPEDKDKIQSYVDFDRLYRAAVPESGLPDEAYLKQIAESVFQHKWKEVSIFEASQSLEGSPESYAFVPSVVWETIGKLADTEDRFLRRSKREQAALMLKMVILPSMSKSLHADQQYKEMKAAQDANNT